MSKENGILIVTKNGHDVMQFIVDKNKVPVIPDGLIEQLVEIGTVQRRPVVLDQFTLDNSPIQPVLVEEYVFPKSYENLAVQYGASVSAPNTIVHMILDDPQFIVIQSAIYDPTISLYQ